MKIANFIFWKVLLAILAISSSQFLEMKDEDYVPHKPGFGDHSKPHNEIDIIGFPDFEFHGDSTYLGVIHLGDKKKAFNVILAPGNDISWVRDANKFNASLYNVLNCSQSSTCIPTKKLNSHDYSGSGGILGYKIYEELSLENLAIQNFSLVLADWDSADFPHVDGVLGLGTAPRKNVDYPNLLEQLQSSGQIKSKSFSMYFGKSNPTFSGEVTGKFIFGGYNPKYASGDFTYVNMTDIIDWKADLNGITFGSEKISTEKFPIVFDTLTDRMYLPEKYLDIIVDRLGCEWRAYEAPTYECDCDALYQGPNLTFNFNGTLFSMPASTYTISYIVQGVKQCFLGIEELKQPYPGYKGVLGLPFVKTFYSYWNVDNKTIGFAPLNNQATIHSEKILI